MGEGYRIIAASSGLGVEEKQTITRCCPSHDALCSPEPGAVGVACYPLPGGRICVAYSCCAGAEHTGRRGQRVYTYNLVLTPDDFAGFGYNPFAIIRAADEAGLTKPALKPPRALPEVSLVNDGTYAGDDGAFPSAERFSACKRAITGRLLREGRVVACVDHLPTETAEVIWMALPGPLRARLSLCAGLRFSNARAHHLTVITGDARRTRDLCGGQGIDFVDVPQWQPEQVDWRGHWLDMVEDHWRRNRIGQLADRSSLPYEDVSATGLDRVGRFFKTLDEVPAGDAARWLAMAEEFVDLAPAGVEARIHEQLVAEIAGRLGAWVQSTPPSVFEPYWPALTALWNRSPRSARFVWPIIQTGLSKLAKTAPLTAARFALALTRHVPDTIPADAHEDLIVTTLRLFAAWLEQSQEALRQQAPDAAGQDIQAIVNSWHHARPTCPIVQQLTDHLAALTPDEPIPPGQPAP